jgi:hypothetical protein
MHLVGYLYEVYLESSTFLKFCTYSKIRGRILAKRLSPAGALPAKCKNLILESVSAHHCRYKCVTMKDMSRPLV